MRSLPLLVAALLLSAPAHAADDPLARGIDPVAGKLSPSFGAFLTVDGTENAPAHSWAAGLTLDQTAGLLALQIGDEKVGDLIKSRLDVHVTGAYAITRWAQLGLDVPVTVWQRHGFDTLRERTGFEAEAPSAAGLGDIRLLGRFGLLGQGAASGFMPGSMPVSLAILAEVRLPTGAEQSFLGERGFVVAPRAVIERTFFDRLRLGFEGGYRLRPSPGRYINLYVGDELTLALAASYRLPEVTQAIRRWSACAELLAATPSRAPFTASAADALKTPLGLLVGVRAQLAGGLQVMAGGGTGLAMESGFGRESFRLFASVRYERIFVDTDGDGIPDREDACPDKAGPKEFKGCPDSDKDGLPDHEDRCPDKPGPKDFKGCPDSDGDGFPDPDDPCPTKKGPKEWGGCPDSDGDGVPDHQDQCQTVKGPKENDGCPDSDDDEVPDAEDKCPNEKGPAKNDGCPTKKPLAALEQGRLVINGSINFDTGKDSIKRDSHAVLDEVVTILKSHPELKKLRIEGHTDNRGGAPLNLDLSKRRARSVMRYIVAKGVEGTRLVSEGYGEEKPVATNNSALGRAKNRRVDFTILE